MRPHTLRCFLFASIWILLVTGCTSSKSYDGTTIGQIEDLIKKGDMTEHIALSQLQNIPHLFALGSATNLKGFIVVDDGKPYRSYIQNDSVTIDSSWNSSATILVYSQVEKWNEVEVPATVTTWVQLEKFVGDEARKEGINLDVAFPFLLKGNVESLSWRVNDWDPNDHEVTNKKIKSSGLKGESENVSTTIVGFYCTKQYRVLAEHDTKMHLHFVSDDRKTSGHIDDIVLNGGVKLYLPVDKS